MTKQKINQMLLKASSHIKKGELSEAREIYQKVLQDFPKNKTAQHGLKNLGHFIDYKEPSQIDLNYLMQQYNQGKFTDVIKGSLDLTRQDPKNFFAWTLMGAAYAKLDEFEDSKRSFLRAISVNPSYADAYNNLGNVLKSQGNKEEAKKCFEKAINLKPKFVEAVFNLGRLLQEDGDFINARFSYERVLAIQPQNYHAIYSLGLIALAERKYSAALEAFRIAQSLNPKSAEVYNSIGVAFHENSQFKEAIEAYTQALTLNSVYAEAYNNMGVALRELGKPIEAVQSYRSAILIKPNYAEAHNSLGVALQDIGNIETAIESYKNAIHLKPNYATAHRNLSALKFYQPNDPQVSLILEIMNQTDLSENDRCQLHYTYAKINHDLGDHHTAFNHYTIAGNLRKKELDYDISQDLNEFYRVKLTEDELHDISLDGPTTSKTITPIFIVGMPRSGTTLIEQVVSSHSKVTGGGELPFWDLVGSRVRNSKIFLDEDSLFDIRSEYLDTLREVSSGSSFVTDKLPHNFLNIGLIYKAFPNAKILHVGRSPAATCWSNFTHYFTAQSLGYSYNLKDTVQYYSLYKGLMNFWELHFSAKFLNVSYERLIADQESETRRIIDYLHLGWEDSCLSPEENRRVVQTASQQQVRQKIYAGSTDAWLKYKMFIGNTFDDLPS